MCNLHIKYLLAVSLILGAACGDAPEFREGFDLDEVTFEFFDPSEGVFPSTVTLSNPNNPFRQFSVGSVTKFTIETSGSNAGAFYAWATVLAREATGENQFFAAQNLSEIYINEEVAREDRERVRQLAIAGFQSVLDNFPDARLFNASGTSSFRLATPAYIGITELFGTPQGDWELVVDENGNPVAIRSAEDFRGEQ